jgi:hypothetical protein
MPPPLLQRDAHLTSIIQTGQLSYTYTSKAVCELCEFSAENICSEACSKVGIVPVTLSSSLLEQLQWQQGSNMDQKDHLATIGADLRHHRPNTHS